MTPIKSTGYFIYFNQEAYVELSRYISDNNISSIFVLADEITHDICLKKFIENSPKISIKKVIKIKVGEAFKNIETCVHVWKELTDLRADRNSLLINLGGGVVTDLGGFVASTFKRGIKFINIPTTLLSMVDASVGSKTGVDLGNLKNLIGAFSDPEMVLIDTDYLNTLPKPEIHSGLAEIIKYGLTFDANLLDDIKCGKWKIVSYLNKIIYQSILIKNKVVLEDRQEENLRKVLNFGHTVGHAIESFYLKDQSLQTLKHGEAVAIGMIVEGHIAHRQFNFPMPELESLKQTIHKIFGKIMIDRSHYDEIINLMKHDKKNNKGIIHFILLKNIEEFVIDATAPIDLIADGLNYYNN
jgi:3-dehydroquinate synthase